MAILDLGTTTNATWLGKISAISLLDSGFTSQAVIDEAVARIEEFYVPAYKDARIRCIDGRTDPNFNESHLGPQEAGGTPGDALAMRLAKGISDDNSFVADADVTNNLIKQLGYTPGGHRDDHAAGAACGCGAVDAMDKIDAVMAGGELAEDLKRLVQGLLGDDFNDEVYESVITEAKKIDNQAGTYFADRQSSLNDLENKNPNCVSTLTGTHNECFILINMVPDTTFATNRFSETFNGTQAFGYDVWLTLELAPKLFPEDSDAQARFIYARIINCVATAMVLTDGSQRLLVRTV